MYPRFFTSVAQTPSAHLLRSHHDPVPVPAAAGGVLAAHADGSLPLHHVVPRQGQVSHFHDLGGDDVSGKIMLIVIVRDGK